MPIPRCEHGLYSPSGDGQPSEYCSGCTIPTISLTALSIGRYEAVYYDGGWMTTDEGEHVPMPGLTAEEIGYDEIEQEEGECELASCPVCWSSMAVADEYDLECAACGFNGL